MTTPVTNSRVPIRVLHVVSVLGHGGMEAGVMKLVTGCDPERVVSDVCTLEPARAFKDMFGGSSRLHELSRTSALDLRLVRSLAGVMRERSVDLVHTHAWGTLVEGWLAARLAGVRHTVHGEHGTMETRFQNALIQRFLWKRADRLLAVSGELADRMSRFVGVPRDRIQVIANGIDLTRYARVTRTEARSRLSIDPNTFVTLSVGRLVPVKNYPFLLKAAQQAVSLAGGWQFLVAGEGPLRCEIEANISRCNLEGVVTLLGHRTDIPLLLAAADAFVLTSHSEGMSNTILEAMAAGRPVVATRVGGNPEIVDASTGLLVSADEPASLTHALMQLRSDPARACGMAAAGRARAEQRFSLSRMTADYTALYESVTGRSTAGSENDCAQGAANPSAQQ